MGGDSASVGGGLRRKSNVPKVFINGEFIIGFCGSWRMGDIMLYDFSPPPRPTNCKDHQYIVQHVIEHLRKLFKEKGFGGKDSNGDTGGIFLLGYRGKIYSVSSDFQVGEFREGIDATGSGYAYALGSLYSTSQYVNYPEWRIETALRAAAEFCTGVCGPFLVKVL